MLENKQEYKHDFSGSCAPGATMLFHNNTFSVGIFQWVPKASGKGLKRTPVKFRIKGTTSNPDSVYERARIVCEKMNKGWVPKTKSEWVYGQGN